MLNDQIKELHKEMDFLKKQNQGSTDVDGEKIKDLERELEKATKKNANLESQLESLSDDL